MIEREWIRTGTALVVDALDALDDEAFAGPSLLPGWTRAHVAAHVHHNAVALQRLAGWAATGVEARMYPSREARDADIEEGATLPPDELRRLVRASAADLDADFDELTDAQWRVEIAGPGGPMPASTIAYLRAQETLVHCVDLDAGVTFDALPPAFVASFLRRVAAHRSTRDEAPALAAWLSGRSPDVPALSPWA